MTVARFLTNAPIIQKVRNGDVIKLSVMAYELDGDTVTGVISPTTGADTTVTGAIVKSRVTFTIPFTTAMFATGPYVEAWITHSGTIKTEVRRFLYDPTCCPSPVRVCWLNLLGGIDMYTFKGTRSKSIDVERYLYTQNRPFPYVNTDRGQSVMKAQSTENIEVYSAFENKGVYKWISEIITSPLVWIIENGVSIPIVVTNKTFVIESSNLYQVALSYQLSNQRISQNG